MAVGTCAGEGEFESGFEEETAKDHEVVAVAILGLHNLDGLNLC